MSHITIILGTHLECAKLTAENASNTTLAGLLATLKTKAAQLDDKHKTLDKGHPDADAMHEVLENIQAIAIDMCDNQNISGREGDVEEMIGQCDFYLP